MKISELVNKLQQMKKDYGDMDVQFECYTGGIQNLDYADFDICDKGPQSGLPAEKRTYLRVLFLV
jgi:hypothetical protein